MTAASLIELDRKLDLFKRSLASTVKEHGPDAHQVEIDHLVWCHAHAEAAWALDEWAAKTGDPVARELAEWAVRNAAAVASGQEVAAAVDSACRLASIADELEKVDDFGDSAEQRLLRASLRQFAEREIKPFAGEIHRNNRDVPGTILKAVATFGLLGLSVPAAYGGSQDESSGSREMLIATEELSRASLAAGGSLITRPEIMVRALLRGGTEQQKQKWLPAIASGERLVAVAVTEPDYGSNVADITCRARPQSDGGWEITGTKLWCTFAGRAELLMVLARTGGPGHKGLSAFAVEKPAYEGHAFNCSQEGGGRLIGRAIPTIGYRGMHTYELSFEQFRVPSDSLIGGHEWLDRGFYLQMEGFALGRIQTAGRAVGLMQAAFDDTIAYTQGRHVFGKPIFANELSRAKIGEMAARLHASRQLSYRAAEMLDRGDGQMHASLAKLYASRMAEAVARDAAQLHGAMGYSEETNVSRYFVDARVLPVFEGAEEVLSLRVIGPALLRKAE